MFSRADSEDSCLAVKEHIVSKDWLEEMLKQYYTSEKKDSKVSVLSFVSKQGCESSDSVLSDILALTAEIQVDEEQTTHHFIIKLLPLDPFSRYFVAEAQFDLREIKFYTQVGGKRITKSEKTNADRTHHFFSDCPRT